MGVFILWQFYARTVYTLCFYISKLAFVLRFGGILFLTRYFHFNPSHCIRKAPHLFLASLWICGILCGIFTFLSAEPLLFPLMRRIPSESASIVRLLCIGAFPFLISILMVSIMNANCVLAICFGKVFLFSFVSIGLLRAFGSAGWLVRLLLLFSNSFSMCFLYFLSLQALSYKRSSNQFILLLLFTLDILFRSFDYRIISPFLARLIIF